MSAITSTPLSCQSIIGSSRVICLEPSPASTYGSSVVSDADDEAPQTPNDEGVLLNKMSKLDIREKSISNEHYSPTFIRNGVHSDDPFMSTSSQSQGSGQYTPTGKSMERASTRGSWRSGSNLNQSTSASASPLAIQSTRSAQSGLLIQKFNSETSETQDYDSMLVSSQDAQAIYPPSSCVFVANLLQSESDEALEVAVLEIFREFGTVFVKIRRDAKHMPFAFCQYTNDESAELAIKDGRGRLIKGRPCRCEKAKAHRLFFFGRKYGTAITPDEVEILLRSFGRLTECRPATHLEKATNNIGEGVVVNFDLFENGKNACQTFRNHPVYKMISLFHLGSSRCDRNNSDPARRAYLDTYEIDRRSIFVGNLPNNIGQSEINELFSKYGEIIKITVHKNESIVDLSSKHCFAFVEFAYQPSVEKVIPEMNGSLFRGKTLRVNQKDSENARTRSHRELPRLNGPSIPGTYQVPTTAQTMCNPNTFLGIPPSGQVQFGGYGYSAGGFPNSVFMDHRGQYWITPTAPYNPPYLSSTPFQASPFQNSQYHTGPFYGISGGPQGLQTYDWHQAPAPMWSNPNMTSTIPNPNPNPPAFSAPVTSSALNKECPSTPNQSGHKIVDSSMEFS